MAREKIDVRKTKEKAIELARKGKLKEAVEQYELLRKHDKKEVQHVQKAAEIYAKLGENAKAIAAYEDAADRYASQGHLPKAIALAKLILQLDSEHVATQERLVDLYAQKGEPVPAELRPKAPAPAMPPPPTYTYPAPGSQAAVPRHESESPALKELPRIPLFSDLRPDEFRRLIHLIELRRYETNETILTEGEKGDSFFVLTHGSAMVTKEDYAGLTVELATLNEGDFFGEFAYLSECERSATVVAIDETEVLEITRPAMDQLIGEHPRVAEVVSDLYRTRVLDTLLRISPLFEDFSEDEKSVLLSRFEPAMFEDGQAIIQKDEPSRGLFILKRGHAIVVGSSEDLASLGPGEFFGEMSLLTGLPTNATVKAKGEVEAFHLSPELFEETAAAHPGLVRVLNAFAAERRIRNEQIAKQGLV